MSSPTKTVETVCLTTLARASSSPASLTRNFPGSNHSSSSRPHSSRKRAKLSPSARPSASTSVAGWSSRYCTLKPLPKSRKRSAGNCRAAS